MTIVAMTVSSPNDPDLASVLEVSQHARQQAQALTDLIAQTMSAAAAAGDEDDGDPGREPVSAAAAAAIAKQQKLLGADLAHLRGLHRQAHFAARETKAQTAEARHEVDRLHLQLQNLYYEQRHLEGEIEACEGYE